MATEFEKWASTQPKNSSISELAEFAARAFAAGQRSMREAVVKYLDSHAGAANAKRFAEAVRELPVEETKT